MPYELEKLVYTTRVGVAETRKPPQSRGLLSSLAPGKKSALSLPEAFGDGPELQKRHGLAVLFCKELLH